MNAPNMQHMRNKVEQQFKPMLQLLQADLVPHGRLLAGAMDLVIAHYEEIFRVMEERDKKLCWYEFCLTPEIFRAMDIYPFLGEIHPPIMSLGYARGVLEVCRHRRRERHAVRPLCARQVHVRGAAER